MTDLSDIPPLVRHLHACFTAAPQAPQFWVAVSGGADSIALLHAAASVFKHCRAGHLPPIAATLHAVHINHALHPEAEQWAHAVALLCQRLQVPLTVEQVSVVSGGEGVEAAARTARYRAWRRLLPRQAVLLTAHHQDDQAETLLLRLMRGSGLRGLAAMPPQRRLGEGLLQRPLLNWTHEALVGYCQQHNLSYVQDPANEDLRHRRSVIRHQILPLLREHWPDAAQQIAQSAAFLREQEQWLESGEAQWLQWHSRNGQGVGINALLTQPGIRQFRLVQQWLREHAAPTAPAQRLHEFLQQLHNVQPGRAPKLKWANWCVQVYRGALYLSAPGFNTIAPPSQTVAWNTSQALNHCWFGHLRLVVDKAAANELVLHLGCRSGGERLLMSNGRHQTVKSILQDEQVPPWWRQRMPLVYHANTLWAVGDLRLHPNFRDWLRDNNARLCWTPPELCPPCQGAIDTP